ncbi:ATP-binding protein [Mucilaginibacter psychrotolerans]|uniref:ATP-binding protein n=1 Tax=Mucilaginibacter psychrotolerans TaxID=1524096 RepID=A0A4Y8SBM5_9SPHI|nr:ATP-binding protein [Mucilaginibacter psychrotolerans]TFF35977.1 ATP-binding protein [Mucilaginibacter psychrotolerans]
MKERNIYISLLEHCKKKQVTVITGMRRVGKSTAVKYILKHLASDNQIYLDCERIEIRVLFNSGNYEGIKNELELLTIDFSRPSVIALDEIQLVENLPSVIKYFYDTYEVKFIVTGSSSYYMKNRFSESLAGRKRIFEMYPLSFSEFLSFKDIAPTTINKYAWKSFDKSWYNRFSTAYAEYIRFGGFPEVVLEDNEIDKEELLKDIVNSYIEIDVKLLADYSLSEDLYKLIKVLAARSGNKIDYTKIASVTGINRQKIASYIQLLEYTYLIYLATPFTKNIDKEISQQTKLYFADTGILNVLAGNQLGSGQVFENAIAIQLKSQGTIQYYQKKTGQEIDFIFNGDTAIEVKETPAQQDLQTISQRANAIGIDKHLVAGRYLPLNNFSDFTWGGNIF